MKTVLGSSHGNSRQGMPMQMPSVQQAAAGATSNRQCKSGNDTREQGAICAWNAIRASGRPLEHSSVRLEDHV